MSVYRTVAAFCMSYIINTAEVLESWFDSSFSLVSIVGSGFSLDKNPSEFWAVSHNHHIQEKQTLWNCITEIKLFDDFIIS